MNKQEFDIDTLIDKDFKDMTREERDFYATRKEFVKKVPICETKLNLMIKLNDFILVQHQELNKDLKESDELIKRLQEIKRQLEYE